MAQRFVDIHTHILPGVDDGAQNPQQAMELLRLAWESGTGAVILTPHYRGRYRRNTPQQLHQSFEQLQQLAAEQLPDMELYLGNEAGIELELTEKLREGRVLTLNGGRYVLLEFHTASTAGKILDGVLDVLNCGYIPVVAHAERYDGFNRDKNLAREVTRLGALIQINADSVLGGAGAEVKRCARRLLRKRHAHFIASDAHDTHRRTPMLAQCYRKVSRRYGKTYAARLFWENARELLADDTI